MSNWTPVTLDNLNDASVAGLVEKLRDIAREQGQTDPWQRFVQITTDEIRSVIGFSGRPLDADSTAIPKGLVDLAIRKVIRLMERSAERALSTDEQADEKQYQKRLEDIRDGKWPIEVPDNPQTTPQVKSSEGTTIVDSERRRATRRTLRGI